MRRFEGILRDPNPPLSIHAVDPFELSYEVIFVLWLMKAICL